MAAVEERESAAAPGSGWDKYALGALGLAAVLGTARFGGSKDVQLYRQFMRQAAREAAPAVNPNVGGEWVNRLMRGSWWHGSPNTHTIELQGFSPDKVAMGGARFGEPAGVSLSANPLVSHQFAHGDPARVLRVWPQIDPKSVLPVWSEAAYEPLAKAYLDALGRPIGPQTATTFRDYINNIRGQWPLSYALDFMKSHEHSGTTAAFNRVLSENLQKGGIQGLLMSPHRYNEYELRVLDPKRAVPIDWRDVRYFEKGPMERPLSDRYMNLKLRQTRQMSKEIPGQPGNVVSLSDLYKRIPEGKITGEEPAKQVWSMTKGWHDAPSTGVEAKMSALKKAGLKLDEPWEAVANKIEQMEQPAVKGMPKTTSESMHMVMVNKNFLVEEMNKLGLGTKVSNTGWMTLSNKLEKMGHPELAYAIDRLTTNELNALLVLK